MYYLILLSFLVINVFPLLAQQAPVAPVRPVVEEYCGEQVTDQYRYMEDVNNPDVQRWFRGQADYARGVLDQIPGREKLEQQLLEIANRRTSEVSQVKITDNDRYFYLKTNQGEEVARLYYRDGYEGEEKLLFDPTTYDTVSGKKHVVYYHYPSWDGSKIAFNLTADGAEVGTLMIMETTTQKIYPERIDRYWFGFSWLPDNERFLVLRLQTDDRNADNFLLDAKTYLHQVGTDPATDQEVFSREKYPDLNIQPFDFPIAYVPYAQSPHVWAELSGVDSKIERFYAPIETLSEERIPWKHLTTREDEVTEVVATKESIIALTTKNAPHFKVIKTDIHNPDFSRAQVVVPESEEVIKEVAVTSEGLFYTTVTNGVVAKLYRAAEGMDSAQTINLPTQAGVISIEAKGASFPELWVELEGWNAPPTRYAYDRANDVFRKEPMSPEAAYPEFAELAIEEITAPSHDGTMVPLSVIYRKGTPRDGSAPLLLQGYGAYGYSFEPYFKPDRLLWTAQGGIYAIAHVRGGGELGDTWHQGGRKTTKPNTWKDFIACAEYLIENRYTTAKKMTINSGSAGGILIGRAMTERPDLFAAAIPQVGVMNVLRSENRPNGSNNTKEYGTVKNYEECKALLEMDAYLHIENNTKYPATLITAGMNDPRVVAWMPAKFAARLQAATVSDDPVIFSVDYEAGHGRAGSKPKLASLLADIFSFALWQTGHPDFQMGGTARGEE